MTKKAFKHAIQRGLGSAVVALKNSSDPEVFRPLVLWACSRDTAYDAQSEGCRSFYLYELITQFPDPAPFLDTIQRRLFCSLHSTGWEFNQDSEVLSYFAADGMTRALEILEDCYHALYEILWKKRRRTAWGLLPERDNFESLCISLIHLYSGSKTQAARRYQSIVTDLGALIAKNPLYSFTDFEWFQIASEDYLGKRTFHRLLDRSDSGEEIRTYVSSLENYRSSCKIAAQERQKTFPETAGEIYEGLKAGGIL